MARRYKEGLLPFKIVAADEPLVARSGLLLPYELAEALRLPKVIERNYLGHGVGEAISHLNLLCL